GTILSEDGTTMLTLAADTTKRADEAFVIGSNNGGCFDAAVADGTINIFVIGNGINTYIGNSAMLDPTSRPNYPAGYKYKRIASILRASAVNTPVRQYGTGRERDYRLDQALVVVNNVASQGTAAVLRTLGTPTGIIVMARAS
ncbi:hypothetical protein ACWGRJ_48125, partial [Bradyrhizobium sp. Lot11]